VKRLRSPRVTRYLLPEEQAESWDSSLYNNSGIQEEDALMSGNGVRYVRVLDSSPYTVLSLHAHAESGMNRIRQSTGFMTRSKSHLGSEGCGPPKGIVGC
jgi:hypothetical protein